MTPDIRKGRPLKECLKTFWTIESDNRRDVLTAFCQVTPQTSRRWIRTGKLPIGMELFRLRHFMEAQGYLISEIYSTSELQQNLGRILAFGILTPEEMLEGIGMPKGRPGLNQLFAFIRGHRGMSDERQKRAEELVSLSQNSVREQVNILHKFLPVTPKGPVQKGGLRSTSAVLGKNTHGALKDSFLATVEGLLPLSEALCSEEFTPKEREELRERGGEAIRRLTLALNRLSSESALRVLASDQQQQ